MLGENIKKFRLENGWTKVQLAEKVGVTATAINFWETNQRIPSCMYVMPLVRAFQIRLEDLFGGM